MSRELLPTGYPPTLDDFVRVREERDALKTELTACRQESEELQAAHAVAVEQLQDAIMVANDLAADHAKETVRARSEYWRKAIVSTPQSVKNLLAVLEAVEAHVDDNPDIYGRPATTMRFLNLRDAFRKRKGLKP